jgi:hypothetical protein
MGHTPRLSAVLIGLLPVAASATALAGDVAGRLQVPSSATAPRVVAAEDGPKPFYWEEWAGYFPPAERRLDVPRELAVVLVGAGAAPESSFLIQGGTLMPSTLVARAGTTLRLENRDGCSYELSAAGLDGFSSLQTAPGNARTVPIPQAGKWVIGDRQYTHVQAHLHVIADLVARAELNAEGRFEFKAVPAGEYTLKVFFRDRELVSSPVVVTERALEIDPIQLNLSAAAE